MYTQLYTLYIHTNSTHWYIYLFICIRSYGNHRNISVHLSLRAIGKKQREREGNCKVDICSILFSFSVICHYYVVVFRKKEDILVDITIHYYFLSFYIYLLYNDFHWVKIYWFDDELLITLKNKQTDYYHWYIYNVYE